jgi:DNA-directed RNA polymerase sigma subunit (sigma70/sigma32)
MAYSDKMRRYETRNRRIRKLRRYGWTMEKIGKQFGITSQRVGQILARHG